MRTLFRVCLLSMLLAYDASASVMVNQAGYLPAGQKLFFTTTPSDSFLIYELQNPEKVFSGALRLVRTNDPATGMTVYKGDFSALTRPGQYRIMVKGESKFSSPFSIADDVYGPLASAALKGFYYQRCGQTLPALFAGSYARSACHLADGTFHQTAESAGFHASTGGWHDAGDYGKYIVNAGVTVGTLLMAYEMFPERFAKDDLGIPESGNGIPDILDETRWELEWMRTMQHTTGGVFAKLTRAQFEGFVMPSADNGTRYIYQIASTATADFAAVFARASRTYRAFDPAFADTCLAAARRAWAYLQSHSGIVPTGGFKNPSGTATGEYGDANDADERLWAAAELFSATGESTFHSLYTLRYGTGPLLSQSMSWPNVRTLAHLAYLYTHQASASESVKAALRQSLIDYGTTLLSQIASEGFRVAIRPGEYAWGSNSEVLNRAILLILASRESGNSAMLGAAQSQLDYILGANAHNLSFVTGIGAMHVMHPHHRPSASDTVIEPVPGLLAGGPEQNRSDAVLQARFTASTPPALIYADNTDSYASNEIAINWNAPLVFVAGYFAGQSQGALGIGSDRPWNETTLPREFRLEQNHPNPFNPSTEISFHLPSRSVVRLDVFDTVGRCVASLIDGVTLEAGRHRAAFDGASHPSGVYLYRLTAQSGTESYFQTKRALLVK
ncbi:MAG: glycoside hydrolase family 9 protein [Acidobacteriota bacterium]